MYLFLAINKSAKSEILNQFLAEKHSFEKKKTLVLLDQSKTSLYFTLTNIIYIVILLIKKAQKVRSLIS